MALVRFGVSLDKGLLSKFDRLCGENKYENRSEAIRDLIRDELVKKEWSNPKGEVTGVVSLVYDHDKRELVDKLIDIQHGCDGVIIVASQHVHLNHDNCLEVIIIKGNARDAKDLAAKLKSVKGVKHGELVMATMGKDIE